MRTRNQITKLLTWARSLRKNSFTVEKYHKVSGIPISRIKPIIQYLIIGGELGKVITIKKGYKGSGASRRAKYFITKYGRDTSGIRVKLKVKSTPNDSTLFYNCSQ